MHATVTPIRTTRKRLNIKPLAERNRLAVGATGIVLIIATVVAAFSYDKIPFIKGTSDHQAYFADAGGIKTGSDVRVSGLGVGRVSGIHLEGAKVRVDFTVRDGVELGDRTEAAIKTETVLGTKVLELTPRGDRNLDGPIPIERTTSPYDLPAALGDLTTTISGLDTTQLSSALTTLAQTFKNTPPDLKLALEGVARFSDTLGTRDAKLRQLLADANKVTSVLAKRSDQIARFETSDLRVLSTAALRAMNEGFKYGQELLFPVQVQMTSGDAALTKELQEDLQKMGFDLEQMEQGVEIRGVPADVRTGREEDALRELLEQYREYNDLRHTSVRDNLAASFGCRSAIRAGDALTFQEMRQLVDDLYAAQMPYTCPHGRPTIIEVPLAEFDKRFGRTS